ncbi:MAG: phosphatase PAP2 family protein [Clostridia bacterium]|nr:phosphatase PAP2 family protein [Clostridia bacterium]
MKKSRRTLFIAVGLVAAFVTWTVLVKVIDVLPIGQTGAFVGFGTLNGFVHRHTGVHMSLYTITDYLGLVPIGFTLFFALLGAWQLIKRKSILKVDRDILLLGGFYAIIVLIFVFFEVFVINYRPVLIDGRLEASYPSSTTLLTMCVMPTSVIQLKKRIGNVTVKRMIAPLMWSFTVFMVISRLLSGVHWVTDIIGGVLISGGLVMLYLFFIQRTER